jgi:hypothetical protein
MGVPIASSVSPQSRHLIASYSPVKRRYSAFFQSKALYACLHYNKSRFPYVAHCPALWKCDDSELWQVGRRYKRRHLCTDIPCLKNCSCRAPNLQRHLTCLSVHSIYTTATILISMSLKDSMVRRFPLYGEPGPKSLRAERFF